jgi:hypothetical protein
MLASLKLINKKSSAMKQVIIFFLLLSPTLLRSQEIVITHIHKLDKSNKVIHVELDDPIFGHLYDSQINIFDNPELYFKITGTYSKYQTFNSKGRNVQAVDQFGAKCKISIFRSRSVDRNKSEVGEIFVTYPNSSVRYEFYIL